MTPKDICKKCLCEYYGVDVLKHGPIEIVEKMNSGHVICPPIRPVALGHRSRPEWCPYELEHVVLDGHPDSIISFSLGISSSLKNLFIRNQG